MPGEGLLLLLPRFVLVPPAHFVICMISSLQCKGRRAC